MKGVVLLMLKAIGKFIDTLPLKNLISAGEANADTVLIEVDRYHGELDLSEFRFIMRGITEGGKEMQSELSKELSEDESTLHLNWKVSRQFTAESGTLFLDLLAYQYAPETDAVEQSPDYMLRYQLPAIEIRNIPEASADIDPDENGILFWTEFKEQLSSLREAVNTQGGMIREVKSAMGIQSMQILELQDRINILVMTQEEYDHLETPDEHTLYVLT